MNRQRLNRMVTTALMAALIFVFTAYIRIPSFQGYTHIGDGVLYLTACLLPFPWAAAAGAIGAGLADLLSGYAIWTPATVAIKVLTVLCFSPTTKKIVCRRNLLGILPALLLCGGGYYLYEALVIDDFITALLGVPGYFIQVLASGAAFLLTGRAFDRADLKHRLLQF